MRQIKIFVNITDRSPETLDRYLAEIGRAPLITVDEEVELAQRIRRGGRVGEKAREKLVVSNLRFVVSVAKQYRNQGLTLMDLINEGNIGLIKAAGKFDETRGFKFISYAVWWIRQSILQAIAEQGRMVRLPLNQVALLAKINQEICRFVQRNQRYPSENEIAEVLDVAVGKVSASLLAGGRHVSMDAPFQDGEESCMLDVIPCGEESRTDRAADFESMVMDLRVVMGNVLQERDIVILCRCFGIGCSEMGLEEIGEQLGLSRERVRQIKERSIAKLRESSSSRILMKYLG